MRPAAPAAVVERTQLPVAPAAASRAVADLLTGEPREGVILGSSERALWCCFGDEVLVIGDVDAVRLPNSVAVAGLPDAAAACGTADWVRVGGGAVAGQNWRYTVVRWWDPRPSLGSRSAMDVGAAIGSLGSIVVSAPALRLGAALYAGSPELLRSEAAVVLGCGAGLTPAGDDLLAAAVAAYRLIGAATGLARAEALVDRAAAWLMPAARRSTTALSASLLQHALRGDVAEPVADLLRALTGSGAVRAAADRVAAIGHSSGPALLQGVVVGSVAACGGRP